MSALLFPEDHRASGGRHGPAEVHRDLHVLDLAALARAVVVGVQAVDGLRAVIVHGAPKLPDVLDDHVHAVGVPLAHVESRRVVGALAAQLDDPAADIIAYFALLTESVRVS